jgi:hypothetical protein
MIMMGYSCFDSDPFFRRPHSRLNVLLVGTTFNSNNMNRFCNKDVYLQMRLLLCGGMFDIQDTFASYFT